MYDQAGRIRAVGSGEVTGKYTVDPVESLERLLLFSRIIREIGVCTAWRQFLFMRLRLRLRLRLMVMN